MSQQFVHTHVHSEHSLLDGLASVEALVQRVVADGNPGISINDHGNMASLPQLMKYAAINGINPIPGMEAYHVPDMHFKERADGKRNGHLILMAISDVGVVNLSQASSIAFKEGFYFSPRLDNAVLAAHSEGLVCTTSCLGSLVNQALLAGDYPLALRLAGELKDIFTSERFFIEVQQHGIPDQDRIIPDQIRLAKQLGVGLIAGQDAHYVERRDAHTHDALLCIGTGTTLDDDTRFKFASDQHFMRTAREMWDMFPEDTFPGACSNTLVVNEMASITPWYTANGKPVTPQYLIPEFPIPDQYPDDAAYLRALAYAGAAELYGDSDGNIPSRVREDLDYELKVITDMQFPSYFLIVWDYVRWAKAQGIAVGPGRGSGAGSRVAYCLKITSVDPIQHGLFFERFLNPGRKEMPDFDIDFEPAGIEAVIDYVSRKYGDDHVSRIGTEVKIKGKTAIKDSSRVLGHPAAVGARLTAMYPPATLGASIPLSLLLLERSEVDKDWMGQWLNGADLRDAYARVGAPEHEILDLAVELEGTVRALGKHASGVLITPKPVDQVIPIRRAPGSEVMVTQFDYHEVGDRGGLKMDFLGLINLSVIKRTEALIASDLGRKFDITKIPLDDPKVFDSLCKGDTSGVFQLQSTGMRDVMLQLQPSEFSHLAALVALYRPGPMGANAHISFCDRKNGREAISVPHPDMAELLKETYGLPIYQEQIMSLGRHFAGISLAEADDFRKAMGKKDKDVMSEALSHFAAKVVANGYSQKLADQLIDLIAPFSGYAFNRAHSVCYGMIAYQTAWLKVNYPAQFAAACIDYLDAPAIHVESARSRGIQVYAPDINRSSVGASTSRDSIRLGLGRIAQLGPAGIENILSARRIGGDFASLGDFLTRVSGVNKRSVESLVKAGAFDQLHQSRRAMVDALPELVDAAKSMNADTGDDDDFGLFSDVTSDVKTAVEVVDLTGPDYDPATRSMYERETVGFFVGTHPYMAAEPSIKAALENGTIPSGALTPSQAIDPDRPVSSSDATVYGIVVQLATAKSAAGNMRTEMRLEAGYGDGIEVILFGQALDKSYIGRVLWVTGTLADDSKADEEGPLSLQGRAFGEVTLSAQVSPKLRLVGGTRRSASSPASPQPTPRSPATPRPMYKSEPQVPGVLVFSVSSQAELTKLASALVPLEGGDSRVALRIITPDQPPRTVPLDPKRYVIDLRGAQTIGRNLGLLVDEESGL